LQGKRSAEDKARAAEERADAGRAALVKAREQLAAEQQAWAAQQRARGVGAGAQRASNLLEQHRIYSSNLLCGQLWQHASRACSMPAQPLCVLRGM
jgi:hypothetical protein